MILGLDFHMHLGTLSSIWAEKKPILEPILVSLEHAFGSQIDFGADFGRLEPILPPNDAQWSAPVSTETPLGLASGTILGALW